MDKSKKRIKIVNNAKLINNDKVGDNHKIGDNDKYKWEVDFLEDNNVISNDNDLNSDLVFVFESLIKQISDQNKVETDKKIKSSNNFRKKSLQTALQIFKNLDVKITSQVQLSNMKIKGIGPGILKRVNEILETGTLEELDDKYKLDPRTIAINSLTTIYSVGDVMAQKLYDQHNIENADQMLKLYKNGNLEKKGIKLTHQLHIGLKYYNEFKIKIPYEEINNFRPIIKNNLKFIDPKIIYEICGSHRRMKPMSGDIDILLAHPNYKTEKQIKDLSGQILHKFVQLLKNNNVIIDDIAADGNIKYMGVAIINKIPRHIDIMLQPMESWPTAIMHATGSDNFNIKMRNRALKLGYRLSEKGLFKIKDGIITHRVKVNSELDIFKILKVKYLPPHDRELNSKNT